MSNTLLATAFACLLSGCATPRYTATQRSGDWLPRETTDTVAFEVQEGTRLAFDLSPDGQWIVFDLLGQLWRIPVEGGAARQLTDAVRDVAEDLDPVISPDGSQIVFQSDRGGARTLFLMPAQGGPVRKLISRDARYFAYLGAAWAPDGRSVAYAIGDTLAVVDVATGAERMVSFDSLPPRVQRQPWGARNSAPAFAHDGSRLAFVNEWGDAKIWMAAVGGGIARAITAKPAIAPAFSPDDRKLGFLARDSLNRWQVFVQDTGSTAARQLTNHEEVSPFRVRWSGDGSLLYSADGGFWRVPAAGGTPAPIPFTAAVRFPHTRAQLRTVTFPEAGSPQTAIGFAAISLAPDGRSFAMIALDTLWIVPLDGKPRALVPHPTGPIPWNAALTWSPDGREVAWLKSDRPDAANLFAANVETGTVRRITNINMQPSYALWSPDGQWIASIVRGKLRLFPANAQTDTISGARDLGDVSLGWGTLAWAPASDAMVVGDLPLREDDRLPMRATWIALEGDRQQIARFPRAPAGLFLGADGFATYVENNQLWRVPWRGADGTGGAAVLVSDVAAIEPRYSNNGSILYLGRTGLELLTRDGRTRTIPWPLAYTVRRSPTLLLVTGATVIDGRGALPAGPRDILIRNGRIESIAAAGSLTRGPDTQVIDAGGKFIIPGLVDLHAHIWDDRMLQAWLHSGVTTVRDISSQRIHTPDLRNRIEAGVLEGPRIVYAAGLFHGGPGFSTLTDQMVSDSAAIARGMSIMASMGSQYIKERGHSHWHGAVNVVKEAHRYGLPVSGHCAHILPVAAAGEDGKEHLSTCFRDWGQVRHDMTRLAAATKQWVVATTSILALSQLKALDDPAWRDAPDVAPFLAARYRNFFSADSTAQRQRQAITRTLDRNGQRLLAFQKAGVMLAGGSDNNFPLNMQHELEAMVRSGMSPMEAIVAATASAARVLNAPGIGTLEPGKLADLLVLDADPLANIANLRRISRIIQGGRIIDRENLRKPLSH